MKGTKATELQVSLEDKAGALGEVTSLLKQEGVNIRAVAGWVQEGKALIRILASDTQKAKEVLSSRFEAEEKEVVIVDMPNETGQLDSLSSSLKDAGVNMTYIYGTTSEAGRPATLVFSSDNNDKAVEAIG